MQLITNVSGSTFKRFFLAIVAASVLSILLIGSALADGPDEADSASADPATVDTSEMESAPAEQAPDSDEDLTLTIAAAPSNANFSTVQHYAGTGSITAQTVGPGPTAGSERIYLSYIYYYDTFEIVAVDPRNGSHTVYSNPVPGEWGAWAIVAAPDGNLYVGTLPHAHLLRLDPRSGAFTDLGRPSDSEEYFWGLVVGSDGKIYGGTYPSAKLVRFDTGTGAMEDLGRMDPTEMYVREMRASKDGFIYGGIGFGKAHLVAYEIATGQHRDILPEAFQAPGVRALIHLGVDGNLYGHVNDQYFRLDGWDATPIGNAMPLEDSGSHLADGRMTWVGDGDTAPRVTDLRTKATTQIPIDYAGLPATIFRLGRGPDGMLYGGTIMPTRLFKIDPRSGGLADIGTIGVGEVYSFLSVDQRLLMANYYGQNHAPLMTYEPGGAPREVHYDGQQHDWRPEAMILGPNHRVYVGARATANWVGHLPSGIRPPTKSSVSPI
jgi:outer membrane protein assembly factor BamB